MGWTTRNHEKSGSNPSLKLAVEIQSSGRETDGDGHMDQDFIEPFIGVHSNSAFGPNKQQTLSCAGGQGQ